MLLTSVVVGVADGSHRQQQLRGVTTVCSISKANSVAVGRQDTAAHAR